MTPEEKAKEYLDEFSVEKSIDLVETMLEISRSTPSPDINPDYWQSVLNSLNKVKQ